MRHKYPTFVLKQSLILLSVFAVIIICCLAAMKIKDFIEQITLDIFQNCDAEVGLNDNAIGRSRYERFYSVCCPTM